MEQGEVEMLWRVIRNALGLHEEPTKPDSNAKIHELAKGIDQHYDALLHRGMPMQDAILIEQERQTAHAELTREALSRALDGRERPPRMR
jgi:hypothetical protein